jgi:predicted dinucleotide-utilizing enzyme
MKCKNDQYGTFKMLPGNVPNPNNDSDPLLSTYSALFLLNLMQEKA